MTMQASRRGFLKSTGALSGAAFLGGYSANIFAQEGQTSELINFTAVPSNTDSQLN